MKENYVARIRDQSVYRGLRWVVSLVQWLCYVLAAAAVLVAAYCLVQGEPLFFGLGTLLTMGAVVVAVAGRILSELLMLFIDLVDAVLDFLCRYEG
jgi:hypothetical protein